MIHPYPFFLLIRGKPFRNPPRGNDAWLSAIYNVTIIGYAAGITSRELKRWLERQGAIFTPCKGSHLHVELNGRFSVLPMHGKDLGSLAKAIKKQLGLK